MAQTIHCDEHGLCVAECELCIDERHERELAELERKLAVAREALEHYAGWQNQEFGVSMPSQLSRRARQALEQIK